MCLFKKVLLSFCIVSILSLWLEMCIAVVGSTITAHYVCVASGGFPKSVHFDWLTALGHQIAPPVPSLFTFNIPNNNITSLMGVSVPSVNIKIAGTKIQHQKKYFNFVFFLLWRKLFVHNLSLRYYHKIKITNFQNSRVK